MHSLRYPVFVSLLLPFTAGLTGCAPGDAVREDRTVRWSTGASAVAFQHGLQGVYLADPATGERQLIHAVDDQVVAVGAPQWSPSDRRLIFTLARRLPPPPSAPAAAATMPNTPNGRPEESSPLRDWRDAPHGLAFLPEPIVYECWLRPSPESETDPVPQKLFEARCNHPGYVGANLAVRWHPQGRQLWFVDQLPDGDLVALFSWDLTTGQRQRVAAIPASATLVFEGSPDQRWLTVVTQTKTPTFETALWSWDHASAASAWKLVIPTRQTPGSAASLSATRQRLPAWAPNGSRFLYLQSTTAPNQPPLHQAWLADPQRRQSAVWYSSPAPIQQMVWHPDSHQVALLRGESTANLELRSVNSPDPPLATVPEVVALVGWNPSATQLAWVTSTRPKPASPVGSYFLIPRVRTHDRLVVASASGVAPRSVMSDMTITFPQWSPHANRISAWATFSPTHGGLTEFFWSPVGLRRGDPAVLIDASTGALQWLPVDRFERIQIGHYHARRREWSAAWESYELARQLGKSTTVGATLAANSIAENPCLFEAICLTVLGRDREAAAKRAEFRQQTFPDSAGFGSWQQPTAGSSVPSPREREFQQVLCQDLYACQVYLSLDLAEAGIAWLRQEHLAATTEAVKLAHATALCHLLLASERMAEYADFASDAWAPLFARVHSADLKLTPEPSTQTINQNVWQDSLTVSGILTLLPLWSADFIAQLPVEQVTRLRARWEDHRSLAGDSVEQLAVDLVRFVLEKSRDGNDTAGILAQLRANPSASQLLAPSDPEQWYEQFSRNQDNIWFSILGWEDDRANAPGH